MSLPVIDAVSHGSTSSSATTLTVSHTVGSASNRILIVSASNYSGFTITGVTYGGTSLSQLDTVFDGTGTNFYLFYLLAPTTGTANIVVTSGNASAMSLTAVSWSNTAQSTTFGTPAHNTGSGASSSNTVGTTSASNQIVIDTAENVLGHAMTATASQTVDTSETANGNAHYLAHITATGANMTLTWSWTGSDLWCQISVALNGVAASDSLAASPTSLFFGGSGSQNVQLTNTGGLTDNITTSIVGASSWLVVNPTSFTGLGAGNNKNFTVSVNQAYLVPGTYTDTVRFTSNNGAIVNVPVTLVVPAIIGSIAWSGGSAAQTVGQGLGIIIGTG